MTVAYLSSLRNQLTNRTVNALLRGGYTTLEEVHAATDLELLACKGVGETQLEMLRSYTLQRLASPPRKQASRQLPTKTTWQVGEVPYILNHEVYYQQLYRWYTARLWEPEIPIPSGSGYHRSVTLNDIEGILVLARMYEQRNVNLPAWSLIRQAIETGGMWIATPDGDFIPWAPPQPPLLGLLVGIDHIVAAAHLNVDRWLKLSGRSPLAAVQQQVAS